MLDIRELLKAIDEQKANKKTLQAVGPAPTWQAAEPSPVMQSTINQGPTRQLNQGTVYRAKIKKAAVPAPVKTATPAKAATSSKVEDSSGNEEAKVAKKAAEGGASGGVPGAAIMAGGQIMQTVLAAKQRAREKEAEAVASLGEIAQTTARQEQSALESLMSAWRAAILGA